MTDLELLTTKLDKDYKKNKICGYYVDTINDYTQMVTVCINSDSYFHYFDLMGGSIKGPK